MIKYIIAALLLGGSAGYLNNNFFNVVPNGLISDQLFAATLFVMLFIFGFSFGLDKDSLQKMKKTGAKILVFPILVALGSLVGGLVAGLILSLNVSGTMAVSSGIGWYTLSGPLIGSLLGVQWGTIGFTANFFRELITIITIPLMVKLDKYAPIASGGGTTMDTTLPLMIRYCGKDTLVTAFSNGLVLSLMAPFIIVSIASL
ncbi:MAG TPA: lysine exporter LysO family protein [Candidatus Bathyarchaeia archaeon]|nr:lysine exporter LysO family protein [Candidatus Bathyarchaeia archaeon]